MDFATDDLCVGLMNPKSLLRIDDKAADLVNLFLPLLRAWFDHLPVSSILLENWILNFQGLVAVFWFQFFLLKLYHGVSASYKVLVPF